MVQKKGEKKRKRCVEGTKSTPQQLCEARLEYLGLEVDEWTNGRVESTPPPPVLWPSICAHSSHASVAWASM